MAEEDKEGLSGLSQTTKDVIFTFATWLGAAELTCMILTAWFSFPDTSSLSVENASEWLHEAAVMGAKFGIIPAIISAWLVRSEKRRLPWWILAVLSILVTLGTAVVFSLVRGGGV